MSTYSSAASSRRANPTVRAALESDREARGHGENVGEMERWISGAIGTALVVKGLRRPSLINLALAALGGNLIYRGATGYCGLYDRLGLSTVGGRNPVLKWAKGAHRGILVTRTVTVDRPVEEVFSFWRNFENFPSFMHHLESVKRTDETHSHWVARAPMGTTIEWDAEIFNERPNEIIAWRSLPGSEIDCAGSVRFRPAPGGRGTEVHVSINYEPPDGVLDASIAWFFREEPRIRIEEDLARFKQVVEAGESRTIAGQPGTS